MRSCRCSNLSVVQKAVRPALILERPMTSIPRNALAAGVAILLSFFAISSSIAQQCQSTPDCPMPLMCQAGFFGGRCGVQTCNADTDCRNGSVCDFGVCQTVCTRAGGCPTGQVCVHGAEHPAICVPRPVAGGGGGGGGGGGSPPGTQGGACGIIHLGQVTKHMGCAPGLRCSNPSGRGICQRLPS